MIMCSNSLDGDAMAKIERWMGFEVVRGSSGSGGREAFMAMVRGVRREPGLGTCLAIYGSRGPRGHVQGGAIALGQCTGGVILPVTASSRPAIFFRNSWDRCMLAWPFARVELVWGEPLQVPRRMADTEFERLRAELEERLIALQAKADRLSGLGDEAPVRAPVPAAARLVPGVRSAQPGEAG
jgi:hypothetical protein